MADLKQIKVGNTTYNIEPFSEYIKPTVNSEYYPKFIQTRYGKDSSSWYGKDYPMYGFWETSNICKITVDNYWTKVDMAVKDANQNVITDTYATKKAVTQEIKDAIDGLIDGAPGTLDTLKELSAAIGDDKDYAVTVTNLITGIDTKVTNEKSRAEGAESGLSARITTNSDNIEAHGTRLTGAETNIAANTAEIGAVKTDLSTNYLPRAGGKMTGNIRMSENSTSIIFRDTSADGAKSWLSGIYANSTGDEVLGIVAKNTRTHIMLGNADPEARPTCTSLTPAIDIKNGKVGINKRIGTDSSADAGSYELDVNGSINASGTIDANSARISNGLYVGTSITHRPDEDLFIGNDLNNGFITFVEDMHGPSSEENWRINTDGEAFFDSGITTSGQLVANVGIFDRIELTENSEYPGLTQGAYNSGDGESHYNFIGFTPSENNNPAILSNSGYISLYDAGPNGSDSALSIEDSPTCDICMLDWATACQQSWNKADATNQTNKKLFLVGAPDQTIGQTTKSNSGVFIGRDNNLYSNGKKTAVEELTMPVTKRFLREHKSEHREDLVDSSCKHFSLIDLYVKDDSGEIHDINFVLTVFGTINVVWGYSDESIENTGGYPAGSATTKCRNGIRLVGYVNHLTKTFTGSMLEKPYSSNTERTIRRFVNEPITDFSASINRCIIDGSMIWWSLDSASTDIKAL